MPQMGISSLFAISAYPFTEIAKNNSVNPIMADFNLSSLWCEIVVKRVGLMNIKIQTSKLSHIIYARVKFLNLLKNSEEKLHVKHSPALFCGSLQAVDMKHINNKRP